MASTSDLIYRLELLDQAERQRFSQALFDRGIDPAAARQAAKTRDELLRIGRHLHPDKKPPQSGGLMDENELLRLPLNAYPDRVVKRRANDPQAGIMVGGSGIRLAHESTVKQGGYLLAIDLRHDQRSISREALVRIASLIQVDWLAEMFPASIRKQRGVEFDPQKNRVIGFVRTWYRDLLLEDDRNAAVEAAAGGQALAAALRPRAREIFAGDQNAANLLTRTALLRQHMPEHPWPAFSDEELADVLAEQCIGKRSIDELDRGHW